MVGAGTGADIFDKLEPEPHNKGLAPQHCFLSDPNPDVWHRLRILALINCSKSKLWVCVKATTKLLFISYFRQKFPEKIEQGQDPDPDVFKSRIRI
jgi:hypothetical protein